MHNMVIDRDIFFEALRGAHIRRKIVCERLKFMVKSKSQESNQKTQDFS